MIMIYNFMELILQIWEKIKFKQKIIAFRRHACLNRILNIA